MPIFLSSDRSTAPFELPFKFKGGFDMSTRTIGIYQSIQGLYSLGAQMVIFPFFVRRFGTLKTFRLITTVWPLLYFVVPYLLLLPNWLQPSGIALALVWRSTAQVLSFPSNAILLANAVPTNAVLGLVNGAAASTASLSRAFGPTISGSISAWGESRGYSGLVWWIGGLIAALGAIESYFVSEGRGRLDGPEEEDQERRHQDDDNDDVEAAGLDEALLLGSSRAADADAPCSSGSSKERGSAQTT